MERSFETLLRWLGLDFPFEVGNNNIVNVVLDKTAFEGLVKKINTNVALYAAVTQSQQDKIVLVRRDYIGDFWGQCRLTIELVEDATTIKYEFLGYEALVDNSVVLVDSISTMMELGD